MAVVTYLLGAGASAERIPVVKKMAESIKYVLMEFQVWVSSPDLENAGIGLADVDFKSILTSIIDDLAWMAENCAEHYSIDTYAKKLYLTDRSQLERLKAIMSFYLTYIQIQNPPDKRYDNFWASILTSPQKLPSKVKMISWNYDFQIEQSYINMSSCENLSESEEQINMLNLGIENNDFDPRGFCITKLNGSARVADNSQYKPSYFCNYSIGDFPNHLRDLVSKYALIKNNRNVKTKLFFAWEKENREKLASYLKQSIHSTEVLTIIGYSFPFFNREIDLELFSMMPNLETVYIQDKEPEAIKERLQEMTGSRGFTIKLVKNVEQFFFPKELDIS